MTTRFPDFCDLPRLKNARTSREIYGMKINFGEKEKEGGEGGGGKIHFCDEQMSGTGFPRGEGILWCCF